MITGKNSALIGFALLVYIAITLCVLAICATYGGVFGIITGIVNTLANGFVCYKIYNHYGNL